jgi:hypothetical protein
MEALKLHMKIESDTIKIPALSKFIGKEIEIILLSESSNTAQKDKKMKYVKLKKLQGKIHFDDGSLSSLREKSIL